MIDTHAHVYQHVTGDFGMNPDEVGVPSGVTTLVDQGGAGGLTFQGFHKFIVEPARTRVFAFISNYLVGGLSVHRYVDLYGPHGIKCHAEVGGHSRWGIETLRLGKQASREAGDAQRDIVKGINHERRGVQGAGLRDQRAGGIPAMTWEPPTDAVGIDNSDLRSARRWTPKTGQSWTPENRPVR
jgi:hypothetical protein